MNPTSPRFARVIRAWLCAASLTVALPAYAVDLSAADKMITLVQAAGCDAAQLRPTLDSAARAFVRDPQVTRVVVDWPADLKRNLDLMGRPSPIAAALELTAGPSTLPALAARVQRALEGTCSLGIYLVHERRFVVTPRTWPLGEASPGIKVLSMLVRKPGLSLQDFDATWSGPHAELALSWRRADGATGGHYVQNLVLRRIGPDGPVLDGIAEGEGPHNGSEREHQARMKAAAQTPLFVDTSRMTMFSATEVILKD